MYKEQKTLYGANINTIFKLSNKSLLRSVKIYYELATYELRKGTGRRFNCKSVNL
jgi:hypothetical protein